ncbi:imm11 family protein [Labrenzia sp. PHM005]|uniref:imm11 family protein n=1 Tax=Labrenzia sp. PHM005 TaxID=2590016 RepID=UPI00113FD41F|nr:DUF1629 domain-containing protein [Labrenzia sp. PHM005]QDG74924.1 hypothetical protein FJ695_03055 [Labrenzia sp. PHM005]
MPVHLSLEYQEHTTPMFEFVSEPKNMALIGLSVGYPLNADRFATVARQQKKKKIHDVFPLPGVNAVSERFKEIVESYEPGVHQFFPVELFDKAGNRVPTNYYIFNCTVCVDAVLVEHSEVRWSQRRVEPYDPFPRIDHWDKEVLSAQAIAGHHVWCGGLLETDGIYVSDALFDDLKRAKIKYFKEKSLEAIDVAWRPEDNIQPILDWVKQNGLPTEGRVSRFLKNYV